MNFPGDIALQPLPSLDDYDIPSDIDVDDAPIGADDNDVSALLANLPAANASGATQTNQQSLEKEETHIERKPRKERPKFTAELLLSENGFPLLKQQAPHIRYNGKGHEREDLNKLLRYYQHWMHQLYPKMTFDDGVKRAEKLCHEKRMKVALHTWRDEYKRSVRGDNASDQDITAAVADEEELEINDERPGDMESRMEVQEQTEKLEQLERVRRVLRKSNDALARDIFSDISDNDENASPAPKILASKSIANESSKLPQIMYKRTVEDSESDPDRELMEERRLEIARRILASSSSEDSDIENRKLSAPNRPKNDVFFSDYEVSESELALERQEGKIMTYGRNHHQESTVDEASQHTMDES